VIYFENQQLVRTRLLGSLKEKSPHEKTWLSSDSCETICKGQAAQHDVATFLQGGSFDDNDNDGQVTKECKNGAGAIDSSKENIVDIGSGVVSYHANPTWHSTNGAILMESHVAAWSSYIY